jgi:hypothetical protein
MKTNLCETCRDGLVREYEHRGEDDERHYLNRCLLDGSFVEIITKCNRYEKMITKTTYHDPTWDTYVEQIKREDG